MIYKLMPNSNLVHMWQTLAQTEAHIKLSITM